MRLDGTFDRGMALALAGLVSLLVLNSGLSYRSVRHLDEDARWVAHTHEVMDTLGEAFIHLREAEAAQRGYLITGDEAALRPFDGSIDAARRKVGRVEELTQDNDEQQARIPDLDRRIHELAGSWSRTAAVRKGRGFDAARLVVEAGHSGRAMAELQAIFWEMHEGERKLLRGRRGANDRAYTNAVVTGLFTAAAGLAAVGLFVLLLGRHLRTRLLAATRLHEQRQLLHATLNSVGDAVIATDAEGRVTFLNPVACSLTGWTPEGATGLPLPEVFVLVNEETRRTVENPAERVHGEGGVVGLANHTILIGKDGTERPIDDSAAPIRDEAGAVSGAVLVFRDVSERRRLERQVECHRHELEEANALLEILAATDGLTRLKNRRAFHDRLSDEVRRASRSRTPLSLMLLDVDHFKQFNDAFGHPAGDGVLCCVARLLETNVRSTDFVARYGGEEFAILLPDTSQSGAILLAERVRRGVAGGEWRDREITVSVGVATMSLPDGTDEALVKEADIALYCSKNNGRNCVHHSGEIGLAVD